MAPDAICVGRLIKATFVMHSPPHHSVVALCRSSWTKQESVILQGQHRRRKACSRLDFVPLFAPLSTALALSIQLVLRRFPVELTGTHIRSIVKFSDGLEGPRLVLRPRLGMQRHLLHNERRILVRHLPSRQGPRAAK